MKKIYHPYYKWECFKNGMYDPKSKGTYKEAIKVLSDDCFFDSILEEVIQKWIFSAEEHLSNVSINRQAWCGQVACCYKYNVPETQTRIAWSMITDMQRYKANKIADKHITNYERKNKVIHKRLGNQMLLQWNT